MKSSHMRSSQGSPWRFGALERARLLRLDAARHALAASQRREADIQQDVTVKAAREARELASSVHAPMVKMDPCIHAAALRNLEQLAGERRVAGEKLVAVERELTAARVDCARCDVQLAVLQKLREAEVAHEAASDARRQQKEADQAWLSAKPKRSRAGGLTT